MCRATYQCYQIDSFLTARPSNRLGFKWVTKRQLLMRNTAHDGAPALDVTSTYVLRVDQAPFLHPSGANPICRGEDPHTDPGLNSSPPRDERALRRL